MKLLSVNVSLLEKVPHERKTVYTGIFKEPVDGRVMLRTMNLDGDGQADLDNHGGIYQAAYVYSVENYDHWRHELGPDDLAFGQFGENFTVERMAEDDVHIGDTSAWATRWSKSPSRGPRVQAWHQDGHAPVS